MGYAAFMPFCVTTLSSSARSRRHESVSFWGPGSNCASVPEIGWGNTPDEMRSTGRGELCGLLRCCAEPRTVYGFGSGCRGAWQPHRKCRAFARFASVTSAQRVQAVRHKYSKEILMRTSASHWSEYWEAAFGCA